jgi:hypothetical protein
MPYESHSHPSTSDHPLHPSTERPDNANPHDMGNLRVSHRGYGPGDDSAMINHLIALSGTFDFQLIGQAIASLAMTWFFRRTTEYPALEVCNAVNSR